MNIRRQLLLDLIVTAFEGGSNYWLNESFGPATAIARDKDLNYISATFTALEDINDAVKEGAAVTITAETMRLGLKRLHVLARSEGSKAYAQHYADAIAETGDAITADVVLQLGLFNEVVFG